MVRTETVNSVPFDTEKIPKPLLFLGEAIGLIHVEAEKDSKYSLNSAWFADPLKNLSETLKQKGEVVGNLLSQVLDGMTANALGIPAKSLSEMGTWLEIYNLGSGCRIFIVTRTINDVQTFGLGLYFAKELSAKTEGDDSHACTISFWTMVPLFQLGTQGLDVIFGQKDHTIQIGGALAGPGSKPLISIGETSFDGLKITAALDVSDTPSVQIATVIQHLKISAKDHGEDCSFADLVNVAGPRFLTASMALLRGIFKKGETSNFLDYLLPLLGFSSRVPNNKTKIPVISWVKLFQLAKAGSDLSAPFKVWMNKVWAKPKFREAWLTCFSGLFNDQASSFSGQGTNDNPYVVPVGPFEVTFASQVTRKAKRYLYPGVKFNRQFSAFENKDWQFSLEANLKVGAFKLFANDHAKPESNVNGTPSFEALAVLSNLKGNTFKIKDETYGVESIRAGFSVEAEEGKLLPCFELTNVQTPIKKFKRLDLADPGELLNIASDALGEALHKALGTSFEESDLGKLAALLLGFAALKGGDNNRLKPPFLGKNIAASIANPIHELGTYYFRLNEVPIDGKKAIFHILTRFAQLIKPDGKPQCGTQPSEWKYSLSQKTWTGKNGEPDQDVVADFYLYGAVKSIKKKKTNGLDLGLGLDLDLILDQVHLKVNLEVGGVALQFQEKEGLEQCDVFPEIKFSINLPDEIKLPEIAGIEMSADAVEAGCTWQVDAGWQWNMIALNPTLQGKDGKPVSLAKKMDFLDGDQLKALFEQAEGPFVTSIVTLLGVALGRQNSPMAILLSGLMGVLPDPKKILPANLKWPVAMPQLAIDDLQNLLVPLKKQIKAILANSQMLKQALGLFAWAWNPEKTATLPDQTGTKADPFLISLGIGGDFKLAVWLDADAETGGIGLCRQTLNQSLGNTLSCDFTLCIELFKLELGDDLKISANPEIRIAADVSGFDQPKGSPDLKDFLFEILLSPSENLSEINTTLTTPDGNLVLGALTNAKDQNTFDKALNFGVGQIFPNKINGSDDVLDRLSTLLQSLDVVADSDDGGVSLNPSGWRALQADPRGFLGKGLLALLTNENNRNDIQYLLTALIKLKLPEMEDALKELGHQLGFLTDPERGFLPRPLAVVQWLSAPLETFGTHIKALQEDPQKMAALNRVLATNHFEKSYGPLSFFIRDGQQFGFEIPADKALKLGKIAKASGSWTCTPAHKSISAKVRIFNPGLGLGARWNMVTKFEKDSDTSLSLTAEWDDGKTIPSLQILPYEQASFAEDLVNLLASYVLNSFVGPVLKEKLIKPYKFAGLVADTLGLTYKDDNDELRLKSLLGLFLSPESWLTAGKIGEDGFFAPDKLGALLNGFDPKIDASTPGPHIEKVTGGIALRDLPLGFDMVLTVRDDRMTLTACLPKLADTPLENLELSVSLGPQAQPGFGATLKLTAGELSLNCGYDDGPSVTVQNGEHLLELVPFTGWEDFLKGIIEGVAIPELIKKLIGPLFSSLASHSPGLEKALANAYQTLGLEELLQSFINSKGEERKKALETWFLKVFSSEAQLEALLEVVNQFTGSKTGIKAIDGKLHYRYTNKTEANSDNIQYALQLDLWKSKSGGFLKLNLSAGIEKGPLQLLLLAEVPIQDTAENARLGLVVRASLPAGDGPQLEAFLQNGVFTLGLNPLAPPIDAKQIDIIEGSLEKKSSLFRQLLPHFLASAQNTAPKQEDLGKSLIQWLEDLALFVLPNFLAATILTKEPVQEWLQKPLVENGPTAGKVLCATDLLQEVSGNYQFVDLASLKKITPLSFLANAIRTLLDKEIQLVSLDKNGSATDYGIWVGPEAAEPNYYGIRLVLPPISTKALPQIAFQSGDDDLNWIKTAGGDKNQFKPGLAAYVPIDKQDIGFSKLRLALINLGFDFKGKDRLPLVDLSRFTLNAASTRGLAVFDFGTEPPIDSWGVQVSLDNLGIALAPNQLSGSSKNPIATNLLGSGKKSTGSSRKKNPPVNPGFSLTSGYIHNSDVNAGGGPFLKFLDPKGKAKEKVWFPVQRSFGPMTCSKIGLGWQSKEKLLDFLFQGQVKVAGLFIDLDALSIGVPVTAPTDFDQYTLGLAGLDVRYSGGVTIEGGLEKQENPLSYTGEVCIGFGKFSVMGMGSYGVLPASGKQGEKAPSFFAFVNVHVPLGPTPIFFINGLAGGFGYNRNLKIPTVEKVTTFPLVAGASGDTFDSGSKPGSALQTLVDQDVVYPELGQYWAAAGLNFSSFKLLNSTALIIVRFGKTFALDLIGVTQATMPPDATHEKALAFMELGLEISWHPDGNVISAEARLTSSSFLLSKDCRLTGGFALKIWTGGDYAGDFVLTLGGYHPDFKVPDHYPKVPRLGFVWKLDSVKITGGSYFALTPKNIMAGGDLHVIFKAGPLKAWLDVSTNFYIAWAPFFFEADISIEVGVAFHTTVFGISVTLSASLGAGLRVWGPPFGGLVEVDWTVISFSIPIGSQDNKPGQHLSLTWESFTKKFLPGEDKESKGNKLGKEKKQSEQQILKVQAIQGLVAQEENGTWHLRSHPLNLAINTVIPVKKVTLNGKTIQSDPPISDLELGILPMGNSHIAPTLAIELKSLKNEVEGALPNLDPKKFNNTYITKSVPAALWSADQDPKHALIGPAIVGFSLITREIPQSDPDDTGALGLKEGSEFYTQSQHEIDFTAAFSAGIDESSKDAEGSQNGLQTGNFSSLKKSLMDPELSETRDAILKALTGHGYATVANPELAITAKYAQDFFQAAPQSQVLAVTPVAVVRSTKTSSTKSGSKSLSAQDTNADQNSKPVLLGGSRFILSLTSQTHPSDLGLKYFPSHAKWLDRDGPSAISQDLQLMQQGEAFIFFPGTLMWLLLGKDHNLKVEGTCKESALQVLCFNHLNHFLGMQTLMPGGELSSLPEKTRKIGVYRGRAGKLATVSGWQGETLLARLGFQNLIGPGCVLRPRNPPKPNQSLLLAPLYRGLLHAHDLIDQNQVCGPDGQALPGWLETHFYEPIQTVVVLVRGVTSQEGLKVRIIQTEHPCDPDYMDPLKPGSTVQAADGLRCFFKVVRRKSGFLSVRTECSEGQVIGVLGMDMDTATIQEKWDQLEYQGLGMSLKKRSKKMLTLSFCS